LSRQNAAIIANLTNQAPDQVRRQGMFARLIASLVKVAVASLIVGTILAHFGITADQILKDFGITPERLAEMLRQGFAWALPNLLLGSLIIVPVWLVIFLFRPPGARSE
jgi:cellobiose-specific phosphotransferase system component IIC